MIKIKDFFSEYIGLILGILVMIISLFIFFNKANECENKGGAFIQGRCVKKEVLVDDKN